MSDDTPATPATMSAAIVDDLPRPLDMVCDLTGALRALEHDISRLKLSAIRITSGLLGMEPALEADVTNCEKRLLCQTIGGQAKRVRGMAWADGTDEGGAA